MFLGFRLLTDIDWKFESLKSQSSSSNDCKTVDSESWRSKKILDLLGLRLRFSRFHQCKLGLRATRVRFPAGPNFGHPQIRRPLTKMNKFCIIHRSNYHLFGAKSLRAYHDFKSYFYLVKYTLKSYHKKRSFWNDGGKV